MVNIKCACGDPKCPINLRLNETGLMWITAKDGKDTLMYLHKQTIKALIDELLEQLQETEAQDGRRE